MKEYSWKVERFWVLLPDCCMVLLAEIFVDWVKHAFITRFNELQVDVYRDYTTSLAYDVAQTRQKHAFSDHSDLVARRMGFIPLPLGVVMIRVLVHAMHISDLPSVIICVIVYLCLGSFRILNNVLILGFACNLITQHKQEKATVQSPSYNNRTSSPLTVPSRTCVNNKDIATSPFHPAVVTKPTNNGVDNYIPPPESGIGSAAIFSNSTVDLKNVSLNEELLKVDGEHIKIESTNTEQSKTKSDPNINCEFVEELLEKSDIVENGIKKRAESEPSLNTINTEDDEAGSK